MFALLQLLANWLARLGLGRRDTTASGQLSDAAQAWELCAEPLLWSLWMPGVRDVLDARRPPRSGARYPVALRNRGGRLGLASGDGPAHIQIEQWEPPVHFAWRLLVGKAFEEYDVRLLGDRLEATARGGESALVVISELERQSRP